MKDELGRRSPWEESAFKAKLLWTAPILVAFHDTDLNVVWANKAYEEATRMSVQEMAGRKCYSVWGLSKPCRGCPVVTAIKTGRAGEAELTPQNQDHWPISQGSWLSKAVPVFSEDGKVTGAIECTFNITQRKQMEDELRNSRQKLATALEIAELGTWRYDPIALKIHFDERSREIFGLAEDRAVPWEDFCDLIHHEDRDRVREQVRAALDPQGMGLCAFEHRILKPDGKVAWVMMRGRAIKRSKPLRFSGTVMDITEGKLTTRALLESEQKFRSLFESSPDGVFLTVPNGSITAANPAACAMLGRTEQELLELGLSGIFDTNDPRLQEALEDRRRSGRVKAKELTAIRKNGEMFPVEVDSVILPGDTQSFVIMRDITERKQMENALRNNLEQFRVTFDKAPVGAAIVGPDFQLLQVNEELCRFTGYDAEELIRFAWMDITHPEDVDKDMKLAQKLVAGEIDHYTVEKRYLRKDGKIVRGRVSVRAVQNTHGSPRYFLPMVVDITERKRFEEELCKSRDELELRIQERTSELNRRAEQLARLSSQLTLTERRERRRLAVIIHDHLQQLLVGAKIRLEVALKRLGLGDQKDMEQVCNLLVESLKTARSLNSQLAPTILYERGLAAGLSFLARSIQETYDIKVETDIDPLIPLDREDLNVLLFESVRELLFNAVKHACTSTIRIEMFQDGADDLHIEVSDQGIGFDPEETLKDIGEDRFGLLSIRERLELIGGKLEIDSSPGTGSTVNLVVPLDKAVIQQEFSHANRAPKEETTAAAPAQTGKRIRVLLVDDHIIVRQGFSSMLHGYSDIEVIGEAANGEEAVSMARGLRPDIVLMDISMPKMSGIEATKVIHSELPHIRVIGLSMYDDVDTAKAMHNAGAVSFLTKSGPSDDLLAAIRSGVSP